jgi:hypothetical protein
VIASKSVSVQLAGLKKITMECAAVRRSYGSIRIVRDSKVIEKCGKRVSVLRAPLNTEVSLSSFKGEFEKAEDSIAAVGMRPCFSHHFARLLSGKPLPAIIVSSKRKGH